MGQPDCIISDDCGYGTFTTGLIYGNLGALSFPANQRNAQQAIDNASQKPQAQTQQQKKQACLNEFNSSPDGKFYNFFSLTSPFIGPNRLESTVEDTAGITAKYAGYKGLRYVADNDVALPELSPILADSIPWIAKEVVLPISLAATAGQVTGHVGCSIASHF